MNRLRNRLILIFAAATLIPLGITAWISLTLLDRSLSLASTEELDQVSQSLQRAGHELYLRACDSLKQDVEAGKIAPQRFPSANRDQWPQALQDFATSGDAYSFVLAGSNGDRLDYLVRHGDDVWTYSASLSRLPMGALSAQYSHARDVVANSSTRNLRRGFFYTFFVLVAGMWIVAFLLLIYFAYRLSHPIQQLTTGLSEVAAGHLDHRVTTTRDDEIGAAIQAFNHMADEVRDRKSVV